MKQLQHSALIAVQANPIGTQPTPNRETPYLGDFLSFVGATLLLAALAKVLKSLNEK